MKRALPLLLAACTGCATINVAPQPAVRADFDSRLEFPVTKVAKAETGGSDPGQPYGERKIDKVSKPLFWTGMILGLVGAGMAIGFGTLGGVSERQIEKGYDEGITRAERDKLKDRGELSNSLAAAGAAIGTIGFSWALITAGIDYSRCGPLSKQRKCKKEAADSAE
jgi:hypothetical protein